MAADPEQSRPELSAEALSEWNGHVESVLRGIAHALNNRAAALSAVIELTRDSSEEAGVIGSILGTELDRVADLVRAVRSIAPAKTDTNAFTPEDVAAEAMAVLRLHVEQRQSHVTIDAQAAPPVRVPRWMFVRALIVLAATAGRTDAHAKVRINGAGDWLVTRVDSANSPSQELTPFLIEIARAMGGEPLSPPEGYGFRVPTLAALRRREGREG